jgi:hypothetical protein
LNGIGTGHGRARRIPAVAALEIVDVQALELEVVVRESAMPPLPRPSSDAFVTSVVIPVESARICVKLRLTRGILEMTA